MSTTMKFERDHWLSSDTYRRYVSTDGAYVICWYGAGLRDFWHAYCLVEESRSIKHQPDGEPYEFRNFESAVMAVARHNRRRTQ